jgi:hypothetical protein
VQNLKFAPYSLINLRFLHLLPSSYSFATSWKLQMGAQQSSEVHPHILQSMKELGEKLQSHCHKDESKSLGIALCSVVARPISLVSVSKEISRIIQETQQSVCHVGAAVQFSQRTWFQNFQLDNMTLSSSEVDNLVQLTDGWKLSDKAAKERKALALKWRVDPADFWGRPLNERPSSAIEVIAKCCQYENNTLKKNPTLNKLRARILKEIICLSTIHEDIQQQRLKRKRDSTNKKRPGGNQSLARRVWEAQWSPAGEEQKYFDRIRKKSVDGRRWLLLGQGKSIGIGKAVSR